MAITLSSVKEVQGIKEVEKIQTYYETKKSNHNEIGSEKKQCINELTDESEHQNM